MKLDHKKYVIAPRGQSRAAGRLDLRETIEAHYKLYRIREQAERDP
jgi:hypothetical protein